MVATRRLRGQGLRLAQLAIVASSIAAVLWGSHAQPGPNVLWSGDACPGAAGVCGTVPLAPVGIIGLGVAAASQLKAKEAGDS